MVFIIDFNHPSRKDNFQTQLEELKYFKLPLMWYECKILKDTGANVSIIRKKFVKEKFLFLKIRELRKISSKMGVMRESFFNGLVQVKV